MEAAVTKDLPDVFVFCDIVPKLLMIGRTELLIATHSRELCPTKTVRAKTLTILKNKN